MNIADRDPATLAPRERVREIGQILAAGYLRARAAHTSRLDAGSADDEAAALRNALQKALDEATENDPSCPPAPTTRDPRGAAAHGAHR